MSRTGIKKKTEYKQVIINNETYRVGDSVKINEYNDDCVYAQILNFWQDGCKPDAFAKVKWYYKPSDIFKEIPEFISIAELMSSNVEQSISVQCIYDKIQVLTLEEYHEKDEVSDDIMFSRSIYDSGMKVLRPHLSQWTRICVCESILNPDLCYIGCEKCLKFFHKECVKLVEDKEYVCDECLKVVNN